MSTRKQIVIIDNHDSFTYNLYQLFDEHPQCDITVIQHDKVVLEELAQFDKIVLSPGPDVPMSYPILFQILDTFKGVKPILGVCLGHQTIGVYFGAILINLPTVYHGQQAKLVLAKSDYLLVGIEANSKVGLYHSWALENESIPSCIDVLAVSDDNVVMAIAHTDYDIRGIQFHPESYITQQGCQLISNWIIGA